MILPIHRGGNNLPGMEPKISSQLNLNSDLSLLTERLLFPHCTLSPCVNGGWEKHSSGAPQVLSHLSPLSSPEPWVSADASKGYVALGNRGEDGVEDPSGALPVWVQGDICLSL